MRRERNQGGSFVSVIGSSQWFQQFLSQESNRILFTVKQLSTFCLFNFCSLTSSSYDSLLFISFLFLLAYFLFTPVHFNSTPHLITKRGK